MKDTEINVYEKINKPQVKKNIKLEEWFNEIKQNDFTDIFAEARRIGKKDQFGNSNDRYNQLKERVPCVTYNFTFDKYKLDKNIISSTGILYFDVDTEDKKNKDFDISNLDTSKILAYYKSFGGNGYAILVRVKGLNQANFFNSYNHILSELKIENYFDKNARKKNQYNVLSYDKDIFINYNSFEFDVTNFTNTDKGFAPQSKKHLGYNKQIYSSERGVDSNTQIRFNNFLDLIDFEEKSYVRYKEGISVIECKLPYTKIEDGFRNRLLMFYCINYVYLNPFLDFESVFKTMQTLNSKSCLTPLQTNEIRGIVKSIIRYRDEKTLKPLETIRFIIPNPKFKGIINRRKEVLSLMAKNKTERSLDKLNNIIAKWNWKDYCKISQRKVYENHNISKKTVEKYWKEVKDIVDSWNQIYEEENGTNGYLNDFSLGF